MFKVSLTVIAALALVGLFFGAIQVASGQTPDGDARPPLNTRETQGENIREVSGSSEAVSDSPQAPTIGFIDSPTGTCYQPDPYQDNCYLTWYYLSVNASPNYMVAMTITVNTIGAVARFQGFFQTSMYAPYNMLGPGFRVSCGAPGSGGAGPNLGKAYAWTINAVDSSLLKSANYGTAYCPAFAP